jgi:hypothetical protein
MWPQDGDTAFCPCALSHAPEFFVIRRRARLVAGE